MSKTSSNDGLNEWDQMQKTILIIRNGSMIQENLLHYVESMLDSYVFGLVMDRGCLG